MIYKTQCCIYTYPTCTVMAQKKGITLICFSTSLDVAFFQGKPLTDGPVLSHYGRSSIVKFDNNPIYSRHMANQIFLVHFLLFG